ncbi:unnamed protein product [Paramecium pentaurelia]|uniref:Uncharacterized protein n=1 Tax=Paramecium pentaurelia TaxID=43138 RepID=A0A8S1TL35_9CILI|nr:unnamed protein product [Paramecium pentaurelia]
MNAHSSNHLQIVNHIDVLGVRKQLQPQDLVSKLQHHCSFFYTLLFNNSNCKLNGESCRYYYLFEANSSLISHAAFLNVQKAACKSTGAGCIDIIPKQTCLIVRGSDGNCNFIINLIIINFIYAQVLILNLKLFKDCVTYQDESVIRRKDVLQQELVVKIIVELLQVLQDVFTDIYVLEMQQVINAELDLQCKISNN